MSSEVEVIDVSDSEDINELMKEMEELTGENRRRSSSKKSSRKRKSSGSSTPESPLRRPFSRDPRTRPSKSAEKTRYVYVAEDRPAYGFKHPKDHHFNDDIPETEGVNPLHHLGYCMEDLATFLETIPGIIPNLNNVATDIYNLGANRPCADPFCRYGRARKPANKKTVTIDKKLFIRDFIETEPSKRTSVATETGPSAGIKDGAYCLPAPCKGVEIAPTTPTAWSRGLDPERLVLKRALQHQVPEKTAKLLAESARIEFRLEVQKLDPKLAGTTWVRLDRSGTTCEKGTSTDTQAKPSMKCQSTDTFDLTNLTPTSTPSNTGSTLASQGPHLTSLDHRENSPKQACGTLQMTTSRRPGSPELRYGPGTGTPEARRGSDPRHASGTGVPLRSTPEAERGSETRYASGTGVPSKSTPEAEQGSIRHHQDSSTGPAPRSPYCYNCKRYGHWYQDCAQPRGHFCKNCGAVGVSAEKCPACKKRRRQDRQKRKKAEGRF